MSGQSKIDNCLCNPYAEPDAPRAANCPVHGKPRRKPDTQQLTAHCNTCKRDITIEVLINVPIAVAAEWMRLLYCPLCGAGSEEICL